MLNIFNNLKPFLTNNYEYVHVREYARRMKISPPSAAKVLEHLRKEGLLLKEEEYRHHRYVANRENKLLVDLVRLYWYQHLKEIGLIDFLKKELVAPLIVLFGSCAKAEVNENADIDLAVFSLQKKSVNLAEFEAKSRRRVQCFVWKTQKEVPHNLLKNIQNGYVLEGEW